MYIHINLQVMMRVYVCMYVCAYVCMYVSGRAQLGWTGVIHTHACICMYVCMYACTCICLYTHMHMYTRTHTLSGVWEFRVQKGF